MSLSSGGHFAAAQVLITAGADLNAPEDEVYGWALEQAIEADAPHELITMLIAAGADGNGVGFRRPLACAIGKQRLELLDVLLDAGADANGANEYGDTALMYAASCGAVEAARRLLARGAAADARERRAGMTALIEAARCNQVEVVQLLIAHGADPHGVDQEGKNALSYALLEGQAEAAAALRTAGVAAQPELAPAIEEARITREAEAKERQAETKRREAEGAARGPARRGKVSSGPFSGFGGIAWEEENGAVKARIEVFGRPTDITLERGQFTFDEQ